MESFIFIIASPLLLFGGALFALAGNPFGWVFLAFAPISLAVGIIDHRHQWKRWPN